MRTLLRDLVCVCELYGKIGLVSVMERILFFLSVSNEIEVIGLIN